MIKGIDVNQRIEFISKTDTEEPKTVFILQPLAGLSMVELHGKKMVDILDASIVEVRNFVPEIPKLEIIKSLSVGIITELMEEVSSINQVTGQDRKN